MDWDAIKLNWKRVRVLAQARWPWMTDADLDAIGGDRTKLEAAIAAHVGITVQETKHQTQEFGLRVEAASGDVVKPEVRPNTKPTDAKAGSSVA